MSSNLLRNGLYNSLAGLIRISLRVLTVPLLIRLIGIQEYGLWTIVSTVVGLVIAMEAGLSTATTIFVSQDIAHKNYRGLSHTLTATIGLILILATLAFFGIRVSTNYINVVFPRLTVEQLEVTKNAIKISSFVVWSRLIQQVIVGIEQAYGKYASMNFLNTIQVLFNSVGLLIIVELGGRIMLMIKYQAIVSVFLLILHTLFCGFLLKDIQLQITWNTNKSLEIIRYSVSTWLANLGGVIFSQVDRLILGSILGSSILGVYAAITNVTSQINQLSAMPVQPILPALGAWMVNRESYRETIHSNIKKIVNINCVVALSIGAILLAFAPEVLSFTLKNEVSGYYIFAFRIAIIIYSLYSLNAAGYYVCFGSKMAKVVMYAQIFSGTISVCLIYIGVKYFGLLGGIVGNVGYLGVFLLSFLGFSNAGIPPKAWTRWIAFPVILFVIFSCLVLFLPALYQGIFTAIALLGYFAISVIWLINTNFRLFRKYIPSYTKK